MSWKRLASNLSRRAIHPLDARRGAGRPNMPAFYPAPSRWHFICGLLMIASGGLAAAIEPDALSSVATFVAWLLLASGSAELAASLRGRYSERTVDMILGVLSLAAGAELVLMPPGSGFSFAALVTTWLLARASAELLAGLLASFRDEMLAAARLARAGVDLLLGLLCLIFSGTTSLVETLGAL